ncbi:MAG: hypothetical protein KKC43_07445, partial [Alphaproteobacteria bacterium]|nr:hypothetical protein [Alphaproteobacteria bacterium]
SGLQRSHMKTTDLLSDPHRASMPPLHANKRIMLRRLKRGLFQQPARGFENQKPHSSDARPLVLATPKPSAQDKRSDSDSD